MSLIFLLTAAGQLLYGIRKHRSMLNPLTIFSAIWGGIVLLYQLRLSGLQEDLNTRTYLLLELILIVFFSGNILAYNLTTKRSLSVKERGMTTISFRHIAIHFIIWNVMSMIEIVYSGGMPFIWLMTGSSKTYFDFGIPSLHGLLISYGLVIILLSTLVLLTQDESKSRRIACGLMVGWLLLFYLLIISRQVLISAVIEIMFVYLLTRKEVPWLKIIVMGVLGVLIFGLIGNLRTGYDNFILVSQIKPSLPPVLSGFYWVYMYLTMTIANINSMLMSSIQSLGIQPILEFFLPSVITDMLPISTDVVNPSFLVSPNFNVSGFVAKYYEGFGYGGVGAAAFIYGAVSGWAYACFKTGNGSYGLLLYAVIGQIVALSFFDDMLLYLPNVFQVVIIPLIYAVERNGIEKWRHLVGSGAK